MKIFIDKNFSSTRNFSSNYITVTPPNPTPEDLTNSLHSLQNSSNKLISPTKDITYHKFKYFQNLLINKFGPFQTSILIGELKELLGPSKIKASADLAGLFQL